MTTYKIGRDTNGNKVVKVKTPNLRAFSIQTLQDLPKTHRNGVTPDTQTEVARYVMNFGTKHQKNALGIV